MERLDLTVPAEFSKRLGKPAFCAILHDYWWNLHGNAVRTLDLQHPAYHIRNTRPMATRRKHLILTPPVRAGKAIKVRLDARTVVMVKNAKALAFWKERYPKAEIIKD